MSDPGAAARISPLQKGVWWAQDYVYAAAWQVRGFLSRVQPASFRNGTRPPVVIIPGVYENWQFMMPLIQAIHDAGHPVHVVTVLQRNKLKVPDAAKLVAQHLEEAGLRDAILVAHSKGGLIGKYTMLSLDPEHRIDRMIAVCSPFSGSRYARYMLLPSLRIFSPRNALTLQMSRELAINSRITSLYGPFDPHIPEGSVLPGATNIELPVAGHFRILGDPATARIIVEQLNLPA
ncbi:pimeloyl-ACP methyl ester carboxylesterase [Pseudarthrobacter defluvii]|uniref:Pimeloyl-ACP methyl ester carboxylesterase n=1 Tax=Pseudarthrobacter defluvii TaxID=410837 RepID=A0ABT9UL37_9MICC|nr:alpha/beta hydrolase [Pseudarthrobacter defluvii]MDQ0120363.1 pimeloyl-ACP methyl ester carboxylesterase [Pseudarthrobacter defluvii]